MTVNVKAGPPAVAEEGLKPEIEGVGALMVKDAPLEVAPPGFITVTVALPGETIRLAPTDAITWLPLTYAVVNEDPFQSTVAPERKPEPLTARVNAGPPAVAELGLSPEMEGVGALIVNVSAFDVAPPGLRTVMLALPCDAIRLTDTEAVNWPLLT